MTLIQQSNGFGLLPGPSPVIETSPSHGFTWGPWDYNRAFIMPVILDGAARDEGSTPTDLLRPGLLMAVYTTTKKATTWVYGGSNGVGTIAGVLIHDVKLQSNGGDLDRWHGFLLVKGLLKSLCLIEGVAGSSPGSWIGGAHDATIRAGLATRFILDDQFWN